MLHALSVAHLFSADQTCILEATHRQTHSQKSKASQFPRENVIVINYNSTILNIKTPMAFYSLIFHSTNSIYKLVYTFNIKTPVDLETIPYYLYSPCNPSSFFFFLISFKTHYYFNIIVAYTA